MNALDQAIAVGLILLVPVENNPLSKSLTDAAQQAELQEHLGSLRRRTFCISRQPGTRDAVTS